MVIDKCFSNKYKRIVIHKLICIISIFNASKSTVSKCCYTFVDTLKSLDEDKRINHRARKLEKILATKLSEFLDSEVSYAVRRVMAAEQKSLYKGPDRGW